MKILVTGAAGFIGCNTSLLLAQKGDRVAGIDNLNDYYDVRLKKYRLKILSRQPGFVFKKMDIENKDALRRRFKINKFDAVINPAARTGVSFEEGMRRAVEWHKLNAGWLGKMRMNPS